MKHVLSGERDAAIFGQEKNARYMQNIATNMKLGNGANEVDVTNAYDYRNSLSHKVKNVHTFSKKKDVEFTLFLEEHEHALARAKQEVDFWKQV